LLRDEKKLMSGYGLIKWGITHAKGGKEMEEITSRKYSVGRYDEQTMWNWRNK
jgi:hypothetical protein